MTAGLDKTLAVDEFRIHYATKGRDALTHQADGNRNGRPDAIEDLAAQLTAARDYYVSLGLKPPLSQKRYRQAQSINVLVRRLPTGNGLAFDETTRDASNSGCALAMVVGADIQFDRNVTAAHELFHLFQYGYAMFKSAWYLEGMARWMEGAFTGRGTSGSASAPSAARCTDVLGDSYSASRFWRSTTQTKASPLPSRLRSTTYSDGRAVVGNPAFAAGAVRPMLEALQRLSTEVSIRNSVPPHEWPESLQKSNRFDKDICQAIENSIGKSQ